MASSDASRDFAAAVDHFRHVAADLLQRVDGLFAFDHLLTGGNGGGFDALGDHFHVLLDLGDQFLDVARALFAGFRQRAHLVGDHGEALAMLAGACRFDGGVQRQQVGLVRDARHRLDDFANRGGLAFQFLDHLDRAFLPLGGAADGLDGIGDLPCDVGDHGLQRLGLGDRDIGILLRLEDQCRRVIDRLQRLLAGARRFFRAGRDLVGRLAHLNGGGGGLGDAAGELRRGGGDALGRLLLAGERPRLALLRLGQRRRGGAVRGAGVIVTIGGMPIGYRPRSNRTQVSMR